MGFPASRPVSPASGALHCQPLRYSIRIVHCVRRHMQQGARLTAPLFLPVPGIRAQQHCRQAVSISYCRRAACWPQSSRIPSQSRASRRLRAAEKEVGFVVEQRRPSYDPLDSKWDEQRLEPSWLDAVRSPEFIAATASFPAAFVAYPFICFVLGGAFAGQNVSSDLLVRPPLTKLRFFKQILFFILHSFPTFFIFLLIF